MSAESTMYCKHIYCSSAGPWHSVRSLLVCTGLAERHRAPRTDQQRLDQGENG